MSTATIDPKHVGGTCLDGDEHLCALADLHAAALALRDAATVAGRTARELDGRVRADHKREGYEGARMAAIAAHAAADTARDITGAIESYMKLHVQPVTFHHAGWRWAIPSQPRGLICTRDDYVEGRKDLK